MNKFRPTQIAAAVSLTLLQTMAFAQAADDSAASQAPDKAQLDQVLVTGIRASIQKSIDAKRNAGANVDVISAEDVGKMPDKNLADSLQRLPGVAVRSDYDEAEKVSLRGTNPDMALILFNGHTVSGGDWYVADQASSSRSTSLSLMPSSVLNQAMVYKTSQANIVDGGLAGTINVTTRKPLDAREKLSGQVNVGGTYADLPAKWAQNLNASMNWKNDANTFGVIGQVFAEKRYMRRDSVSTCGNNGCSATAFTQINTALMPGITDASLAGTGLKAADLNGVRIPTSISTELAEGERDRKGFMFALQSKPNEKFEFGLTGFFSSMNANNYGRLVSGSMLSMLMGKSDPNGGTATTSANTLSNGQRVYAQIKNPVIVTETTNNGDVLKVLQSADIVFPDGTTPQYVGNLGGNYRAGAVASSGFLDFDAKWQPTEQLVLKSLLSTTRGVGKTDRDNGITFQRKGTGISYQMDGLDSAPGVTFIGAGDPTSMTPAADGSGYSLLSRAAAGNKTSAR